MPTLTIWALRAAIGYLVAGFTIGALMLIDKGTGALMLGPQWLHVHMHWLLFGFLVQTIFAVAYWMLPTFLRERPRSRFAVAAVVLVNLACLVALAFPLAAVHLPVVLAETAAIAAFIVHAWPRIKAFRNG